MSHEDNESGFRGQKGTSESDSEKKGRFGGILKENPIKGFSSGAITRPLTGLFRKTGRSQKKADYEDSQEPTVAAPPTSFPSMPRISATIESVQINDESENYRGRNPETGSKLTLSDGAHFGNGMHPLTHYFKVGEIDISTLGRSFPSATPNDDANGWVGQSIFLGLEKKIKEERVDTKDQPAARVSHFASRF